MFLGLLRKFDSCTKRVLNMAGGLEVDMGHSYLRLHVLMREIVH